MSEAQAKEDSDKKDVPGEALEHVPTPQHARKETTAVHQFVEVTPRPNSEGNLLLRVGLDENNSTRNTFLVSLHALHLASPVLETLLDGFIALGIDEKGVLFPFDDAEAFEIALLIAHNQFHRLPKKLDLRTLSQLAILAAKYKLVPLLTPFVTSWTNALPPPHQSLWWKYEHQFLVAHVFGDRTGAQAALKELVIHTTLDSNGAPIWKAGTEEERKIDDECLPEDILAQIYEARSSLFYTLIDCSIETTWENVIRCKAYNRENSPGRNKIANRCDLAILGFVTMHLRKHRVLVPPLTDLGGTEELIACNSPFDFAHQLADLPVEYYKAHVDTPCCEHTHCLDHVAEALQKSVDKAFETFFENLFLSEEEEDLAAGSPDNASEKEAGPVV